MDLHYIDIFSSLALRAVGFHLQLYVGFLHSFSLNSPAAAEHTGIVVHAWTITAVYYQDLDSAVSKTTHKKFHGLDKYCLSTQMDIWLVSLNHETRAINPSVFPAKTNNTY